MIDELEKKIGYTFKDKNVLLTALTHSSYANENAGNINYNERMEFLGDSVLGIVTADYLFNDHKNFPEGQLTKVRSALVCENSCYKFAKSIDLGKHLRLGKGEENTGGRERVSILADAFEALIAAIYIDGGMEQAKKFILNFIVGAQTNAVRANKDYKTALQEIIQKNPEEHVEYFVVSEKGPDHDKSFCVEVRLNSNVIGRGEGRSKKIAEQSAAAQALELMGL